LDRFVEKSFAVVNITIKWQGELDSVHEVGINENSGKIVVRVDVSTLIRIRDMINKPMVDLLR
jgi:GDP-D-mannose dehydratase